jgi:hypothetical protein
MPPSGLNKPTSIAILWSSSHVARAGVPNPKFAILRSNFRANFEFDQDTSKLMILVSFMVLKFARWTRGDDGANF